MNRLLLSLTLLLLITAHAFATEQVFTLKDGSSVRGELTGVSGGVYTIRTAAMGDVKIDASKISSMADASWAANSTTPGGTSAPGASGSTAPANLNQKIESTQAKIMSDPRAMAAIKDMMNDEELMKLMMDPSITQAVMSHDVEAIKNNPKAQALMNNPTMQKFMNEFGSSAASN